MNINDLENIIDYVAELKVQSFTVNELLPLGRGKNINDLCIDSTDYKRMSLLLNKKRKELKGKLNIRWAGVGAKETLPTENDSAFVISKCGAGLTELTIEANGRIRPCPFLLPINENIRDSNIENIWFFSPHLKKIQDKDLITGKCNGCNHQYTCGGGCRARSIALSDDFYASDARCIYK